MSLIRCRKCLIPRTRPDTAFGADGTCSACTAYDARKLIDWDARKRQLEELLDRHHGECLVASSGGKDSHFIALSLKAMGAKVTTITATTDDLTPIGRRNISNLQRHVDGVEVTLNTTVRRKIARHGLRTVGDISWAEHVAIWTIPFRMAVALRKPLLFYGEEPQMQYGAPAGYEERKVMTREWVAEFGGLNGMRVRDLIGVDGITERDLALFTFPSQSDLEAVGVTTYYFGAFEGPWDSLHATQVAMAGGFEQYTVGGRPMPPCRSNLWPAENLDAGGYTGLHDRLMWCKFGFGRGSSQASIDIRAGRMTREEGLAFVEEYDGAFPEEYLGIPISETLIDVGVTRAEYSAIEDRFANRDLLTKESGSWRLKP